MSVLKKIQQVMELTGYLQKDGEVSFGRTQYSYLSEEKITNTIRTAMLEVGLILYPIEMQVVHRGEVVKETEYRGKTVKTASQILNISAKYRIQDVESGEYIDIQTIGEGMDSGDKTAYKAMTGAFKYAQRQTFMIPTGDDPDRVGSEELLATMEQKARPSEKKKTPNHSEQIVTKDQANRTLELTKKLQLDSAFMTKLINDEFKKNAYRELDGNEVNQLNKLLEGML